MLWMPASGPRFVGGRIVWLFRTRRLGGVEGNEPVRSLVLVERVHLAYDTNICIQIFVCTLHASFHAVKILKQNQNLEHRNKAS